MPALPDNHAKRKKYRSDGAPTWTRKHIEGPGVWVTCVKGKEKQAVGELYDLFDSVAAELWPEDGVGSGSEEDDEDEDLETQIAKELSSLKRPRKEQRFIQCKTEIPCVLFISCKAPVDPVKLVRTHLEVVQSTGASRTKYTQRLVPVSATCAANIPEIVLLAKQTIASFFSEHPDEHFTYKIDMRMRSHAALSRATVLQEIAQCMPEGNTVQLEDPEACILVEIFKGACGMSMVRGYHRLLKFNVMELANAKHAEEQFGEAGTRV
ncbi:hypothetical protein PLICRDRAFT_57116 [Plicaturopsis crispa FD-325 SS-3]|uniref:THUMP domain-containing protein n=1 Tax=Plicaturopsis crispa FD-325 SS-3 TaxID=944288 RepID=A0A0C9T792_PLICR|nr:hypothetical protein PLICRDRAFT_57116 [Plicaturopsis crispa FD-325 SS-3]